MSTRRRRQPGLGEGERGESPWSDMALVGRVARAHGLRGQVAINPETDFPEARFEPGRIVYREGDSGPEALRIATLRFQRGRPIVGFDGVESIEAAERLAGSELRVPVASLVTLPPGSFYHHDLAGCRVELRSGALLGHVDHVEGDGGASRLSVTAADGEVLVPLAADICVSMDMGRKVIVIDPPEGLLELNERRDHGAGIRGSGDRPQSRVPHRAGRKQRSRRRRSRR